MGARRAPPGILSGIIGPTTDGDARSFRLRCQWPLWGDDGEITHEYCGAPVIEGLPYCLDHAERAYRAYRVDHSQHRRPGRIGRLSLIRGVPMGSSGRRKS